MSHDYIITPILHNLMNTTERNSRIELWMKKWLVPKGLTKVIYYNALCVFISHNIFTATKFTPPKLQ